MIFDSFPHLRYAQAADFSCRNDGLCHCKTIPFYIFAQAYEGHYEIDAGGAFAVCEEGGAFFVPPNLPLKIWHYVNPGSGIMRVRFVHFIPENSRGMDPFSRLLPRLAITRRECREPAKIIQRLLSADPSQNNFQTAADFLHLLALLSSFMSPETKPKYPDSVERLLQWIHEHASEAIHTSDLETEFPFSRSKLFSIFHAATGMSPGEYILRERIHYAARVLLGNPEISVKEVAELGGWKTPYHFSRQFHRVMGDPPGQYTKKARSYQENL